MPHLVLSLPLILLSLLVLSSCGEDAEPALPEGMSVLAEIRGDLDGDGRQEIVRLAGRGDEDSLFRKDLCLVVGPTSHLWPLPSAASSGYQPTLLLIDVTGDGHDEVVMTAATGGSGGMVAAMVATVSCGNDRWEFTGIFDSESRAIPRFGGSLADGFVAFLEVTAPGLDRLDQQLDLAGRRDFYLQSGAYDEAGKLQKPVAIWGDGLMALEPVAPTADGPGLRLIQQPRGVANVDRLAEVHTLLVWRDGGWLAVDLVVRPPGQ